MRAVNVMKKIAVSALFTSLSISAMATILPFSATYSFSIENKYNGTATRKLLQNGNQWLYQVNANSAGFASASQNTAFQYQKGVVLPISSTTKYSIFGAGRTTNLTFNHAKKQLTSSYKGETKTINMPTTALDDLSLEIQIREDLKANKFRNNYVMADRNKVENVPFTKSTATKITVPAGTFDVVRIDRVHDDKNRKTSFWLAPKLDYLPVKVVQNNDGKTLEMRLTKVN